MPLFRPEKASWVGPAHTRRAELNPHHPRTTYSLILQATDLLVVKIAHLHILRMYRA